MNRNFNKMSVERWTLSVERSFLILLASLLLAAAQLPASPLQWRVGNPGVPYAGELYHMVDLYGEEWRGYYSFVGDIQNYGTASADNMVSERLGAINGKPLDVCWVFDGDGSNIPWTANADGSVTLNYFVGYGQNFSLYFTIHVGDGSPPRLRLSAMAGNGGGDPIPFNDLIIGPPYARPSLALARQAPPGPGTNAVAIAISSDAEFLQLQYTDTLAPTNWTDLARVAVTGAVTVATDTNTAPARFYRALVPVP